MTVSDCCLTFALLHQQATIAYKVCSPEWIRFARLAGKNLAMAHSKVQS